jgi:beta-glucanase (GH16 family)
MNGIVRFVAALGLSGAWLGGSIPAAHPQAASQPSALSVQEDQFIDQLAERTWTYLHSDWATDNRLPWSWRSPSISGGDFANPTEIGLYALSWIAAYDLQRPWSPAWSQTETEVSAILDQLRTWQTDPVYGKNAYNNSVFYQWYWINSSPPGVGANVGDNHLVPSVDNAWLAASLITIREYAEANNHPALAQKAEAILQDMDFTLWYDYGTHRFFWGDVETPQGPPVDQQPQADYYSNENRIINFIARALGQLSEEEFQLSLNALEQNPETYAGITVERAAWDGSYFTYAGPALFIREMDTLYGWNTILPATQAQIQYAEDQGYAAWGLSDSYDTGTGGYVQQGALPVAMSDPVETRPGLVSPHASALAVITPLVPQAIANLVNISSVFDCDDPLYGFRDSVMTKAGADFGDCSDRFSALNQEWIFLSLANYKNGFIWNYFYRADRVVSTHAEMYDPSWAIIWSDEFNENGSIKTSNWICDTGTGYPGGPSNWGTGEIESYSCGEENIFQSGGYLNIRAIHTGSDPLAGWTSSRIETARTDFQPSPDGVMAVEARIRLPDVTPENGQGYWPAFWMLGAPFRGNYLNWPSIGEIDIMENINGLDQWWGALHCGTNPGGPCNEPSGLSASASGIEPSPQEAFHTYRVEFDKSAAPQQIRWYVDGVQRHSIHSDQVNGATWSEATNHGFFILLNLAIGGGWAGNPTGDTISNGTMLVDYVRVYYLGIPIVHSILRASPNPSHSANVDFMVVFSEPVNDVDTSDFVLAATGVNGAFIKSISGSGTTRAVTVFTGSGNGTIRLDVPATASITDTTGNSLSGLPFTGGEIYTINKTLILKSIASHDGHILESTETSNKGGTRNATGATFFLGDNAQNKQYRAILSFNTKLPSGAVITKVTLKIKYAGKVGTNPFSTHGNLLVDVRKGAFSNNNALQLGDFQAAASKANTGNIPKTLKSGWYVKTWTSGIFDYINKGGVTQFRLRFAKDDNNDLGADYLKIYSGNAGAANRPQLIVEYYVP